MNDSFLNSANAPYVAELFFKFKEDPTSIDKTWSKFFNSLNDLGLSQDELLQDIIHLFKR